MLRGRGTRKLGHGLVTFRVMSHNVPHRNCRLMGTSKRGVNRMADKAVSPVHGVNVNVKCIRATCATLNARVFVSIHKHGLGTMMMGTPFEGWVRDQGERH